MKSASAKPGAAADWRLFWRLLFLFQEIVRRDAGLLEDGPQGAFRHIAGMIGNRGVPVGLLVVPDLMTADGLAIKGKAECFEPLGYLPVTEPG